MSIIRLLMTSKKKPTVADYKGARVVQGKIVPEDYKQLKREKQIAQKKKAEQAKNELESEVKDADRELKVEKEKEAQEEKEAAKSLTFLDWVESIFDSIGEWFVDLIGA
jgi:uncharacterized protein (DUF3084 family)